MRTTTKKLLLSGAAALSLAAGPALAAEKLKVVTTLHFLAAIARDVGGAEVDVEPLSRPQDDPHMVMPTPARMVTLGQADVLFELGLQLELWAENVIDGARNPKIRRGFPGQCLVATGIDPLEVPTQLTRALGDVHPFGNPHVWFDPLSAHVMARNMEATLAKVSPDRAETWAANRKAFDKKLDEAFFGAELVRLLGGPTLEKLLRQGKLDEFLATKKLKGKALEESLGGWLKKLRPFKGARVIGYHRSWAYLAKVYGLDFVEYLEPKLGVPPTPGHLEHLEKVIKERKVAAIVLLPYDQRGNAEDLCQKNGIKLIDLPNDVDSFPEAKDWFSFHDLIVDRLAQGLPAGEKR